MGNIPNAALESGEDVFIQLKICWDHLGISGLLKSSVNWRTGGGGGVSDELAHLMSDSVEVHGSFLPFTVTYVFAKKSVVVSMKVNIHI